MATLVTKLLKKYLTAEEFNQFKRESNKERKRKWREANSQKNWENDLRSRLKRRANEKFGPENNEAKQKWIQEEFDSRVSKDKIKLEGSETIDRSGNTVMTDSDSLQILAGSLGKLDLARKIETEVNDIIEDFIENSNKKKRKVTKNKDIPAN